MIAVLPMSALGLGANFANRPEADLHVLAWRDTGGMMKPPIGFTRLCEALHQDAPLASGHALAVHCLAFVATPEKPQLVNYLRQISGMPNAELKGLLNRSATDISFESKGARSFIDALLAELDKP